jgi:hypothetical protein
MTVTGPTALVVPSVSGKAALAEVERVPWADLRHCYGRGRVGPELHEDLRATLQRLGEANPERVTEGIETLWSNACHQGTIYEATPYAVPFIAAVAQDEALASAQVLQLGLLLLAIGESSAWETRSGTSAGSFGEGVADNARAALRLCRVWLVAIGARCPQLRKSMDALLALLDAPEPTRELVQALGEAIGNAQAVPESEPRPVWQPPGPAEWVRHPRFGVGQVLAREEGKVRVRFGEGPERVLLESVVTACDPPS